ncbi:MAG: HAD-IA family hydrolase [Anaerolineales bacterium]|nr:HAD-IA family hydrolase [Anaerolineales bacterium]
MTDHNPGLKAILFDFMGVLLFLRGDYAGDKTVDAVDGMIGGVVDDDAFRKAAQSGLNLDDEAFEKALSQIPDKYELYPPLWDLLPALRKKYKLGIINNGTRLTYPYFDAKLNLADKFEVVLSSGAEGVRKPDPEIYLRAARRLGAEPKRCLFMDDSNANIEGARQVGMQTVLWTNREEGVRRFIDTLRSDGLETGSPDPPPLIRESE